MPSIIRRFITAGITASLLVACGTKGPLYLPDLKPAPDAKPQTESPSTTKDPSKS